MLKDNENSIEDHENSIWTKVIIDKLPAKVELHQATPIGNFPSGELLLPCYNIQRQDNLFYTYDPIKKKFNKLVINVSSRYMDYGGSYHFDNMYCLFEEITSLDNLLGFRKKSNTD